MRALAAADGAVVATAGDGGAAALRDPRSGARRAALRGAHAAPARCAALSADGARLATASPDRRVAVWDAASGELLGGLPALAGSRVDSFAADGALRRCALALFEARSWSTT